jgi:hypothetical protein
MQVDLAAEYEGEPDKYFWLRDAVDGSEVDAFRRRVARVFDGLPPRAFMMIDSAVAGESGGSAAVHDAIAGLPEEFAGIPIRRVLTDLAEVLDEAPAPPPARRAEAMRALETLDVPRIQDAISWVADALEFSFPGDHVLPIKMYIVASGVPLGGLTGYRIDDSPVCFVAVRRQEGSTFAEAVIHEATHVLDMTCQAETSLVAQLRSRPGASHQLWHVPYFVAAAEATRRFVDPDHRDFGDTHGYYPKVPDELMTLEQEGVVDAIRNR